MHAVAFERDVDEWAIPGYDQMGAIQNWILVRWYPNNPVPGLYFQANNAVLNSTGEYYVVNSGSSTMGDATPTHTVTTVSGTTFEAKGRYTEINPTTVTRNDLNGFWIATIGSTYTNISQVIQDDYWNWIENMRIAGYNIGINGVTFDIYLTGDTSQLPPLTFVGAGGVWAPPGAGNPPPNTSNTTTTNTETGTTTTGTGSGTTSITNTSTTTITNNYTYNVTNTGTGSGTGTGTGGGTSGPIDFAPVINAVEQSGEATVTAITNLSTALTTHGDPGTNALAAGTATAPTDGAEAADALFGGLHNQLSLAAGGAATLAIAIPFPTGAVTYTVSSTPEPGSALDQFRIVVRACLTVLVGIAFVFLCIKTLRYY